MITKQKAKDEFISSGFNEQEAIELSDSFEDVQKFVLGYFNFEGEYYNGTEDNTGSKFKE